MFDYTVKKSARAKRLKITIHRDASVVVTIPKRTSLASAELFVQEKRNWILGKIAMMKRKLELKPDLVMPKGTKAGLEKNKELALALILDRLHHFNQFYGFAWKNVSVKNLSTRWGSCSKIGNLNFSYKILYLPKELADYLVVHELCHLKEFNHSKAFWALVEETIPEYLTLRRQLRGTD
jgi:predicted metal-dependent hydrolase